MSLDEEIAYFRRAAYGARTRDLALIAFGIYAGLKLAKQEQKMEPKEKALLLTVARILRAKVQDEIYAAQADDLAALNEALGPFDPLDTEPVNQAST